MTGRRRDLQERDARMAALAADGLTLREIARAEGVSYEVTAHWKRLRNVPVARDETQSKVDRNQKIARMYRQGITLEKIGQQFGVTRECIRRIVRKQGVKPDDGGQALVMRTRRERKRMTREARCLLKYGFPEDVVKQLRADGVVRAYENQRHSAAARGIAWRLDFASWFSVWQTSGKLHLRGRGKGKYVMSRIKDNGCYELGNVHIQSAVENSREAASKWRGKRKEHRGVFCLYPGLSKPFLATVNRVHLGFFASVEDAVEAQVAYREQHGIPVVAVANVKQAARERDPASEVA